MFGPDWKRNIAAFKHKKDRRTILRTRILFSILIYFLPMEPWFCFTSNGFAHFLWRSLWSYTAFERIWTEFIKRWSARIYWVQDHEKRSEMCVEREDEKIERKGKGREREKKESGQEIARKSTLELNCILKATALLQLASSRTRQL